MKGITSSDFKLISFGRWSERVLDII